MRKVLLFHIGFLLFLCLGYSSNSVEERIPQKEKKQILVFPLDQRPVNNHFLQELSDIQNVNIIFPDDNFFDDKHEDRVQYLSKWAGNFKNLDGVIISVDGFLFGGLLQSRDLESVEKFADVGQSRAYFDVLRKMKINNPDAMFVAYKTIPRLTTNVLQDKDLSTYHHYYQINQQLDKYYFKNKLDAKKPQFDSNEINISFPAYLKTRNIHLALSNELLKVHKEGIFSELIFCQDDSAPTGLQIFEQSILKKHAKEVGNQNVYFINGTDEIDHVLLNRILPNETYQLMVQYSNENAKVNRVAFESKKMPELIKEKEVLYNFRITQDEQAADSILLIHFPGDISDEEMTRIEFNTENQIKAHLAEGKTVTIVDLAFSKQNRQLAPMLIEKHLINENIVYSSWNTASNTLGLSLSQTSMYMNSNYENKSREQIELLTYRILKDYYYKSIHLPNLKEQIKVRGMDSYDDERVADFYPYLQSHLTDNLRTIENSFLEKQVQPNVNGVVRYVNAPLNRLFEIDFTISYK